MQSKNLIGQTLLDRFRVDAFIGAGGMGAVYQVWDLQRSVYLAMKTLHADLADDPAAYRRFKREAESLKNLSHPHIVPFYGIYESEPQGLIFLLEGFINGPSLKEILYERRGQPLELGETLASLRALSAALGYAHALGVIHLDVKPGNVLLDAGGSVYLTDFGIARQVESTTSSIGPVGTPAYMAPEQVRGDLLTPATDIYALGVLLYEMLTGRRPFLGTEPALEGRLENGSLPSERIRSAHLWLEPPDPRAFNPRIPPGLAAVVLRALAKDPAQRFSSAGELYAAAERAVGSEDATGQDAPWPPAPPAGAAWDATLGGASTPRPPTFPLPGPAPYKQPRSRLAASRKRACLLLVALSIAGLALGALVGTALFRQVFPTAAQDQGAIGGASGTLTPDLETPLAGSPAAPGAPTLDTSLQGTLAPTETPVLPGTGVLTATAEIATPIQGAPSLGTPSPGAPTQSATSTAAAPTAASTASPVENQRVSPRDGMLQMRVPAGPFLMGTDDSPWFFLGPQHTVTLDAYWTDQTQVTNAMYARYVEETGYRTQAEQNGSGWVFDGQEFVLTDGADWLHPHGPGSNIDGQENYPVVQVTWADANAYCTWAGRRLLTEAEWEKAARGTDGRTFPWGEGIDCSRANYATVAGGGYCTGGLTPVDAYPDGASPYGVLDMAGNAWDWVADWWQNDYYTVSPAENPTGPETGNRRTQRGGAWYSFDLQVQSAYRYPHNPLVSYDSVSFRCGESE